MANLDCIAILSASCLAYLNLPRREPLKCPSTAVQGEVDDEVLNTKKFEASSNDLSERKRCWRQSPSAYRLFDTRIRTCVSKFAPSILS